MFPLQILIKMAILNGGIVVLGLNLELRGYYYHFAVLLFIYFTISLVSFAGILFLIGSRTSNFFENEFIHFL